MVSIPDHLQLLSPKDMPVHTGHDEKGRFYQYGGHGKKYYYTTERGRVAALAKAMRQQDAVHAARGKKE